MPKKLIPYDKKELPVKNKGVPIITEMYRGSFTREDIKRHVQQISKEAKKNFNYDGQLSVALKYDGVKVPKSKKIKKNDRGWRSGYFTNFGNDIALYNIDSYDQDDEPEQDVFSEFQIYFMKTGPKQGGCDGKRNDCLFDCLKKTVDDMPWKFPSSMKKFLDVERNDKIDIGLIPKIEERIEQYKINVTGDHTYTSVKKCQRVINIKLINGHYKLAVNKNSLAHGCAYTEKKPLFYGKTDANGLVSVYDENGERIISNSELKDIKTKPITSPYTAIPIDNSISVEEQYEQFIKDADELKVKTDGLINLYKTGTNVRTALKLFDHFNNTISAEPIKSVESEWLQKTTCAALIFADNYKGPTYKYDVCSHYPSLMSHRLMFFPIKEGTFNKITNDEFNNYERLPYGIYRCVVEQNKSVYKQFRYNKFDYYTHIDLAVAKELNLKIEMIQDSEPNTLIYQRSDLVTGSQLFKPYYDYMFKLKQDKVNRAKDIMNVLAGALIQKNTFKRTVDEKTEYDIREYQSIRKLYPKNDNQYCVEYCVSDRVYETNYARIAPFYLARGRQLIRKSMMLDDPTLEHVKRLHTDGWLSTKKLDIKIGTGLGDIKFEGYCKETIINNCISVTNYEGKKKDIHTLEE